MGILLVVDAGGLLLGTITDGDVRRGMLRGDRLEESVDRIMHRSPISARQGSPREDLLSVMQRRQIQHLPLVDEAGRVVGLELLGDLIGHPKQKENPVILLAGGLGSRLRPLTDFTPKSLLMLGDRPLLPLLIDQIAQYGFRDFLVAVHHEAQKIQQHIGNGENAGLRIRYLRESEPLGTVGAVRLAREELDRPFLVVNADLLTKVNFEHLLEFHELQRFDMTIAVKEYEVRIPYGVVQLANGQVCDLMEKPIKSYFVNAGIYVLNPSLVDLIPEAGRYDMTDLIQVALQTGKKVGGFPIHEYWLDIGEQAQYERAGEDLRLGKITL